MGGGGRRGEEEEEEGRGGGFVFSLACVTAGSAVS